MRRAFIYLLLMRIWTHRVRNGCKVQLGFITKCVKPKKHVIWISLLTGMQCKRKNIRATHILICRSACECLRPWLLAPNSPYIHACKHISAGSLVCHTAVEDNFKVQLPCISTRIGKYKQQVTGNKYGWEFSRIRWQVIGIRLQVTGIEDQQ